MKAMTLSVASRRAISAISYCQRASGHREPDESIAIQGAYELSDKEGIAAGLIVDSGEPAARSPAASGSACHKAAGTAPADRAARARSP